MAYGNGGLGFTDKQTKKRPGRRQDVTDGMDPVASGYARSRYNQGIFDHNPTASKNVGQNRRQLAGAGFAGQSKSNRKKRR